MKLHIQHIVLQQHIDVLLVPEVVVEEITQCLEVASHDLKLLKFHVKNHSAVPVGDVTVKMLVTLSMSGWEGRPSPSPTSFAEAPSIPHHVCT